LVYSVFPLAESMFDYVWNYDTLKKEDEDEYVRVIMENANKTNY
jgi:hypothetical protein